MSCILLLPSMNILVRIRALLALLFFLVLQVSGSDGKVYKYYTYTNGKVVAATTTYAVSGANPPAQTGAPFPSQIPWMRGTSTLELSNHVTSAKHYHYHSKATALAYPDFNKPKIPKSLANRFHATELAGEALSLIALMKQPSDENCNKCKSVFQNLIGLMKERQELLSIISGPFCDELSAVLPMPICIGLLKVASTDLGAVYPALDIMGVDGQALCAFTFGVCDLPSPPKLDKKTLFKGTKKPKPKQLTLSKKEPLKVLHISDYHLDLRYVVGSEASCGTGTLCCRVFPYTNSSANITEPAELFGNYLCDTPSTLATSTFRGIPKATGLQFSDFAFGIFTGDLVSHDLWELTPQYVQAEELTSYQQFFNGLQGVSMYPTLGNHDTFPHAFTAFKGQHLAQNASYPSQQLYNYESIAHAWASYGWLSVEDAQTVITSGLGIYRTITKEGLVIISLNSDVWYYFNFYSYIGVNQPDKTGMFSTLIDYLLEAEKNDQAVWIIQHVNTGGSTDYEAIPAPTDLYYAIVDRFNNTIRGTFFGHTHSDEFGVWYANNATEQTAETAAAVAYIMPSVTPYQNLNAGFRYYLVDPESFAIIDSLTYYANVSNTKAWTRDGDVTWEFEYSARHTYDPKGVFAKQPLTPAFWHTAAEAIATDDAMYHTYTDLRTKKFRPYTPDSAQMKSYTICGLKSMSVPVFEKCVGSMASLTSFL